MGTQARLDAWWLSQQWEENGKEQYEVLCSVWKIVIHKFEAIILMFR